MIDIITIQPAHVDFPLFRFYLEKHRNLFNKVIVYINDSHNALNLSKFLKEEFAKLDVVVINTAKNMPGHDWRSTGTNLCLAQSTADKVLFLEQDMIFKDEEFLEKVCNTDYDILGFKDDAERIGRLHPAFLLVKREIINRTSLVFSAKPPEFDHFGIFSSEIEAIAKPTYLQDVSLTSYEHLAGLTHNYSLVSKDQRPCYMINRFIDYNQELLTLKINHSSEFLKIIEKSSKVEKEEIK